MSDGRGRLVWSSGPQGTGRRADPGCARCGKTPCACEPPSSRSPGEHDVRVRRETGGRKGKTVTTAGPFLLTRDDADELLRSLKRTLGGGGTRIAARTSRDEPCFTFELQGDHADRLVGLLEERGYRAKRAGG